MPCEHFPSGGTVATCHQCGKCPEKCCGCKECLCPVCRCSRIPQEVRDKIIADQKALETTPEEAAKLAEQAKVDNAIAMSPKLDIKVAGVINGSTGEYYPNDTP